MMKHYEPATIEWIPLNIEDILTASGFDGEMDNELIIR